MHVSVHVFCDFGKTHRPGPVETAPTVEGADLAYARSLNFVTIRIDNGGCRVLLMVLLPSAHATITQPEVLTLSLMVLGPKKW